MIDYSDVEALEARIDQELQSTQDRISASKDKDEIESLRVYVAGLALRKAWSRPYIEWHVKYWKGDATSLSGFCEALGQFILDMSTNSFDPENQAQGLASILSNVAMQAISNFERRGPDVVEDGETDQYFSRSISLEAKRN